MSEDSVDDMEALYPDLGLVMDSNKGDPEEYRGGEGWGR